MSIKELHLFCDESHPVKHDGFDFFVLGSSIIESSLVDIVCKNIENIKNEHGYKKDYEIKWSKINGKNIKLIKDIISYVKKSNIGIRILVVPNKSEKEYKLFLEHEEFYRSMYFLLLSKIFSISKYENVESVNLVVDERNASSKESANKIIKRVYLHNKNIKYYSSCVVDSKKEQLVQIIDLFVGAASYEQSNFNSSLNKMDVISHIKKEFGLRKLVFRSSIDSSKYNVFIWDGRYGKN